MYEVCGLRLGFALPLSERTTTRALLNYSRLVPIPLHWAWSLLDGDGDGYASSLGGLDCDDTDPGVYPMAVDVPGNGKDENCSGSDASYLPASFAPAKLSTTRFAGERPKNLVLITGEAIRADRLVPSRRHAFKNLASFASGAFDFARAYASAPRTNTSITGVMTGRYPSRLAWDISAIPLVSLSKRRMLPDILRASGYTTYAFSNGWIHKHMKQIKRGFVHFEKAPHPKGSSALLVGKAIEAIRAHDANSPFFLWIHLFDPHAPYVDSYDEEVQRVDQQTGKLLGALRQRGDWSRTAVIFTADHAEALGDHQTSTHSHTVYNSEVHVPLFMRVPGLEGGQRTEHVSLIDLAPTILDILGVSSELEFDGRSLLPQMLDAKRVESRPVFAVNCFPVGPPKQWIAVYWRQWKLVRRIHEGRDELFDIYADPQESHDLSGKGVEVLEALKLEASLFWERGSWTNEGS